MSGIATAVVVGGALSSRSQRKAAQQAAGVQAESSAEAITEQRRQFDITQTQAEPFRQAELESLQQRAPLRAAEALLGEQRVGAAGQALTQQQALLGLSGQEEQRAAFAGLQESPGQAFLRERQEQGLLRQSAAIGGLGGGQVRTALQQQAAGFAQQDLQNQLARLSGISGAGISGGLGSQTTQNLAQQRAMQAQQVGGLLQAGGQAQAGGILGAGAARSRFFSQAGGAIAGGLASMPSGGQAPAFGSGQVTSQPSVFNQQPAGVAGLSRF